MDFSLEEIVSILLKRIWLIVLITIAGFFVAFAISSYIIRPSYTASVQMYVNPNDSDASANLNELYYAQKVVNTYISFLQTKTFYKQVATESNLSFTPQQIKDMTKIQAVNNTEIFEISVTSYDSDASYRLAEVMQDIVPDLIRSIKSGAEISIVDPAVFPKAPSGPNILMNSMLGGITGLLGSVLGFILWEIINIRVKNKEDLLKRYKLPVLGMIPDFDNNHKTKKIWNKMLYFLKTRKTEPRKEHFMNENTKFIITEAYKSLRINLRFTLRDNGCKKVIVSSPTPEDGKSTTSVNLAIAVAQTGAKVLIMDCDLRKGRLHNYFNIKNVPGLSDTLSGMTGDKEVIRETMQENIHVMTMGVVPPNPTELLASTQMEELLKKLEKQYDYIIIDTPPINIVSDMLSLVKLVDGVLLVVREGVTTYPNISCAINKYEFAQANVLGFVINGVSLRGGTKLKSKYYYYQSSEKDD